MKDLNHKSLTNDISKSLKLVKIMTGPVPFPLGERHTSQGPMSQL